MLDLSLKQKHTLINSTARMNFWVGAVRSGKSYASLIRWLEYIQEAPPGNLVMIGKTASTIKHNLVDEICNLIGSDARYFVGKNELNLWGRRIYLIAAVDERSEQRIRGSSFAGAYIDEATLIPESFWTMLLSRLSIPGAKLFATTNPDTPFHYIKKNYLDRVDKLDMKIFNFYLDDNPSLTDEFKTSLKQEYRGLWYRRYILGQWILAEGTIYDFFDEEIHTILYPPGRGQSYYIGIDYGTKNPCAFVLVAHNPNHYPNMWVEKEYYYDSTKSNRQKTDTEYAEDLIKFTEGYPIDGIYVDPSAASFKLECQRQGIRNIYDAENEVLDGIRFVAGLLTNGTLKVCKCCKNLISEMGSYVWNEKSKNLGKDVPNKDHDHCFAAGTRIKTLSGDIPIELIGRGEKVLTPVGYKHVEKVFVHEDEVYEYEILGQKIRCTKDHKFFTLNGWKEAQNLLNSDMFLINLMSCVCLKKSSFFKESNIGGTYPPKILPTENILEHINQIALKEEGFSIETFGSSIMEKYPMECIFITQISIPETMTLVTLNASQFLNTCPNILKCLQKNKSKLESSIALGLDLLQKNGMRQRKESFGIKHMGLSPLKTESPKIMNARCVEKNLNLKNITIPNFVLITVNPAGEEKVKLMMRLEHAQCVIRNLEQINTQRLSVAPENAQKKKGSRALNTKQKNASIAKKSLEPMDIQRQSIVQDHVPCLYVGKQSVYNLHVKDFHGYFVHNILTLNCQDSLRYILFTKFGKNLGNQNRMTKERLDDLKRKVQYEGY